MSKENIWQDKYTDDLEKRIVELEEQYSMIWRIRIQLDKGQQTSKEDLKYINEINKQIAFGEY